MVNTLAPFGFADSHRLGAAPNYQTSRRWISPSNVTPIYKGDPVVMLSTGYITQATPSATQIAGIFNGCEYMSISRRLISPFPWWSGTGDAISGIGVQAQLIDDPLTVFRVQANGQVTQAMLGSNAPFVLGTGNQASGMSGAQLDVVNASGQGLPGTSATMPFRIVDLITDPPGANGTDITNPYNWCYVTFNNQDFKSLTGI